MSPKYLINLLVLVAGGFLVVASQTFAASTAGWLGLGVGVLAVLLGGLGLALSRFELRAAGYAATALLGVWTIVSSTVFSGGLLSWLVFADALALAAVALAELTVHEVRSERVVHTLVVSDQSQLVNAA